jgi:hypothetical protein
VRAARNGVEMGEHPSATHLRPHLEPGFRGMVRTHGAELWAFACTTCGYLELHVLDAASLAYIAEHWVAVPPPPAPG